MDNLWTWVSPTVRSPLALPAILGGSLYAARDAYGGETQVEFLGISDSSRTLLAHLAWEYRLAEEQRVWHQILAH